MSYPNSLDPLLNHYVQALLELFPEKVHGIYLYGSIALKAYEEENSDIDLITVFKENLSSLDFQLIEDFIGKLCEDYQGARQLDGMFLTLSELGKQNVDLKPYPFVNEGVVRRGYWDINFVTWWTLQENGITLYGQNASDLPFRITWSQVEETMRYNLHHYWTNRVNRPETLYDSVDVSDAVLTLCRIHYTLSEKKIIPKVEAGKKFICDYKTSHWIPLVTEAINLRNHSNLPKHYSDPEARATDIVGFIHYIINRYKEY